MADYDLNAIADALADTWRDLPTGATYDSEPESISVYSEAQGVATVPAIVIELDDVSYDLTMGRGSDTATFLAYFLLSTADSPDAQRSLRAALSSGGVVTRLVDKLVDNDFSAVASIVHMTGTRSIGNINYAGVDYLGATLEIEVTMQ